MKSLATVQKITAVLQVLSLVVMVIAFALGVCLMAGGVMLLSSNEETVNQIVQVLPEDFDYTIEQLGAHFLSMALTMVVHAVLFLFVYLYLRAENNDGTPFTRPGAMKLRSLGIKTIVLSIVSTLASTVVYNTYKVDQLTPADATGGILTGVAMILLSFVFFYGADLEKNGEPEIKAIEEKNR